MSNLAQMLSSQGKYEEAEAMNRQTLVLSEKALGPEHPSTLTSMGNWAGVLSSQGKYKEAEAMNRQTLARREKVLGPEHPDTLMSIYCLAHLLWTTHRYNEALALYKSACSGYEAVLGMNHSTTRACRQHYIVALSSQEQSQASMFSTPVDRSSSARTGEGSALLRGLAKIGIRRSK
jgi:tetratricopeptide (TPR) repeat protein